MGTQYEDLHEQLQAQLLRTESLLRGDPAAGAEQTGTLPAARGELERAVLDRGRVWRGVRPEGVQQGQLVVNLQGFGDADCTRIAVGQEEEEALEPQEDPQAQAAAAPHGIVQNMVLFLFQQQNLAELGQGPAGKALLEILLPGSDLPEQDVQGLCRLPAYYLGEFRVTNVAGDSVTLTPTLPLGAEQIKRIEAKTGTWTLCEIMPVDRHDIFAGLDAEQLQALFPQEAMGLDDEHYKALIEEYQRDNQKAAEGDVAERTWTRVKFLQPYDKIQVDAEVDPAGQAAPDRDFDASGLAVSPLLRQQNQDPEAGPTASFQPGQTALLDSLTAAKLVEQGICQLVPGETVYRRPLRDYDSLFHQLAVRLGELDDEMALVQRQTQAVAAAAEETKNQVQYREEEQRKLEKDLEGWQGDSKQLDTLWSALEARQEEQRKSLSHLYRENNRLLAELDRLQTQLRQTLADSGSPAGRETRNRGLTRPARRSRGCALGGARRTSAVRNLGITETSARRWTLEAAARSRRPGGCHGGWHQLLGELGHVVHVALRPIEAHDRFVPSHLLGQDATGIHIELDFAAGQALDQLRTGTGIIHGCQHLCFDADRGHAHIHAFQLVELSGLDHLGVAVAQSHAHDRRHRPGRRPEPARWATAPPDHQTPAQAA